MITRSTPEIDYLPPEACMQLGFSGMVGADGFLHISGVAPIHGPDFAIVGKGDLKAQCKYVLDVLGRTLKAGGSSPEALIDIVVLLTDFNGTGEIGSKYVEIAPLLAAFSGEHRPASTAVGVSCLFKPEQMIELRAVARILG